MITKWEPPRDIDLDTINRHRARSDWREAVVFTLGIAGLLVLVLTGVVWG